MPLDVSFHWYCKEQLVKKLLKILWKTSMVESNLSGISGLLA